MILVDTSAWVEYHRATGSPVDQRLAELIEAEGTGAVSEPIVMEVLAGARSDEQESDLYRCSFGSTCCASTWPPTSTGPGGSTAGAVVPASRRVGWWTA